MFGLFSKSKPAVATPAVIVVTLNAKLQPMHRGELEDAFSDVCKENEFAAEVVGGGTLLEPSGEVKECDIEVQLDDASDASVGFVRALFEAMLAPVGSRISVPDREPIAFGTHQGLGLYLNGIDLPDETYASGDSNHVFEECARLLDGIGMVNSHWQGPTETALYMYGRDFERMHAAIRPLLDGYPLCRQCRVVRIA